MSPRALPVLFVLTVGLASTMPACASNGEPPPGPLAFAPETDDIGDRAAIFLRGRTLDEGGKRIAFDVIARGLPDVHGAAFRVTWDHQALKLVETSTSNVWSRQAIRLAKESLPGELVVTWTEKGENAGFDATSETPIGTLVFETIGRKGTPVTFRADRSKVVDRTGNAVRLVWRGGGIPAR